MIFLFLLLLPNGLKVAKDGTGTPITGSGALIAFLLDLWIARTTWRLIAGPLHDGERTISDSLERLCVTEGPDKELFIQIGLKINRIAGYAHIKVLGDKE